MINIDVLERNGLESKPFSEELFGVTMGDRLEAAGLGDVAHRLAIAGARKHFLAKSLTPAQLASVNNKEGMVVAEEAAEFQKRVALVKVEESFEGLNNLRETDGIDKLAWTFTDTKYHAASGNWAGKDRLFWTRKQVTDGILEVGRDLKTAEFGVHFEDGYRPLGVQEGLYRRRYTMTKDQNPDWSEEQIMLETRAKTAYTPKFAAHKGGAAVDMRVRDLKTGELIDIGHGYPDGGAIVALESPIVTQEQWQNRLLLSEIVTLHI